MFTFVHADVAVIEFIVQVNPSLGKKAESLYHELMTQKSSKNCSLEVFVIFEQVIGDDKVIVALIIVNLKTGLYIAYFSITFGKVNVVNINFIFGSTGRSKCSWQFVNSALTATLGCQCFV